MGTDSQLEATTMKFLTLITLLALFLALVAANPVANPSPEADAEADAEAVAFPDFDFEPLSPSESSLEKRAAKKCTAKSNGKKYSGTCVDVRKGKQCANGLLLTGFCKGGNTIICCLKGYVVGAKIGFGNAPKSGLGK